MENDFLAENYRSSQLMELDLVKVIEGLVIIMRILLIRMIIIRRGIIGRDRLVWIEEILMVVGEMDFLLLGSGLLVEFMIGSVLIMILGIHGITMIGDLHRIEE